MPKFRKARNRHLVDRLFDIREQIKALEVEEKAMRAEILDSGDTVGDEYVAMVKNAVRHLLDRQALEVRFGREAVAQCTKESPVTTLSLFKKADSRVDVFATAA